MSIAPHSDLELRVAEAATGDAPLDLELRAHVDACASCAALVGALRALGEDADRQEPDEAYWRSFDERLRLRLPGLPPARRPPAGSRRRWLVALPLAAAIAALAVALVLMDRSVEPSTSVAEASAPVAAVSTEDLAEPGAVLAAASEDSLEVSLLSLGFEPWQDEVADSPSAAEAVLAVAPAPAWGDALGAVEEDLARLDESEQQALAQALREAT